jgi:hypothetical protein
MLCKMWRIPYSKWRLLCEKWRILFENVVWEVQNSWSDTKKGIGERPSLAFAELRELIGLKRQVGFCETLTVFPSVSMFVHNGFKSSHLHVQISLSFSRIESKNWWFRLDTILWTSSCCGTWINQYGSTLCTEWFWDSACLDSEFDYPSELASATLPISLWGHWGT